MRVDVRRTVGTLELDVAFDVGLDECVAGVGPNGAGKSTLVRALASPSAGVVFQDRLLFPHMTALRNVEFPLPRDRREEAFGWLLRLGVSDVAGLRPAALSGGQAARVALARAMAPGPSVLLLDEPFAGVDAAARALLRKEIAAFAGPRLLVTHDPLDANALASRVVVLEAGKVVQQGTPADIAARPRSAYVAQLVGVNLLRGNASGLRIDLGGAALATAEQAYGPVLAVVHPRAVALHASPPGGTPRNVWPGRVEGLERLGDRVRVRVGGVVPLVAEVTPAAVADLGLAAGLEVWAAVKATDVAVYPA